MKACLIEAFKSCSISYSYSIMIDPEVRVLENSIMYALSMLTWGEEALELGKPTTLFASTQGHGWSHNHGIKNPLRENHTNGIIPIEASST